jgi:hypothetical protein
MTQTRAQMLMLVAAVAMAFTSPKEQLWGRLRDVKSERGSQSLEWAIIGAIAVGLVAVVAVKITAAVTTHAAQIK